MSDHTPSIPLTSVEKLPLTIVGLGEVLWDVFPDGPRFGGAPANFACSAAGLAGSVARCYMVSAVGRDELGRQALTKLGELGVKTDGVAQLERPTGTVTVQLDDAGHASYEFAADTAWDNLGWSNQLHDLAKQTTAVCFGTLGQRSEASAQVIRKFVRSTSDRCLKIFDVNLRTPFWTDDVIRESLPLCNALKCNDEELPVLARLFEVPGSDERVLSQLVEKFGLQFAALTRGAAGSLLVSGTLGTSDLDGVETAVVDTVGAGDSFTAALALGLLHDLPLKLTHAWATQVAAFVCSQAGATPSIPEDLRIPG